MKRKIRQLFCVAFGVCLVFGMSGCGNDKKSENSPATTIEENTATTVDENATTTVEDDTVEAIEAEQAMDISNLNLEYGQQEAFKKLYDQIQTVENAENFEGTWNRTNVVNAFWGEITVTNQNTEGFDFIGDFSYYSHAGYLEGRAYFVAPNVALFEYCQESFLDSDTSEGTDAPEYVVFEKTEEGLNVIASASSGELGLGMDVFADGTYVTEEPVYTNATVLDDNFTAEEQEHIKTILGDAYDIYFKDVVELGTLESSKCTLEDGTDAVFYEAFIPTMGGYRFELLKCANGDLYFYSEAENVGWKTSVPGAIDYPVYVLEGE